MPAADPDRPRPSRAAVVALALGLTFLTAARLPWNGEPIDNEALYLLAAWKWWRPEFLASDWTFAAPWREHALFNALAGLLSLALPMGAFQWVLRLLGWFAAYAGLAGLLRRLAVPWWGIPLGLLLWWSGRQAFVAGEWLVGGAEAKPFAYAALFASLSAFLDRRHRAGGLWLGLTFSLHPAVGVGAVAGTAMALLLDRMPWRSLAQAAVAALATALPGLVASAGVSSGAWGPEAWGLIVRARLPHHLDPLAFPPGGSLKVALFLLLLALVVQVGRPARATRFVAGFIAGTAVLFAAGIVARAAGAWTFLQVYPFRLLPLLLPLLVPALLLGEVARRWSEKGPRQAPLVALVLAVAVLAAGILHPDPAPPAPTADRADVVAAAEWVADSAAPGAVVLASPGSKRAFWDFRRAQVVNWWALRYDRFGEWLARINALAGPIEPSGPVERSLLDGRFEALPSDSVSALGRRYGASFLVTRTSHPFPVRFRAGAVTVYALPAGDSLSPLPPSP